jgi:hypothetical protein
VLISEKSEKLLFTANNIIAKVNTPMYPWWYGCLQFKTSADVKIEGMKMQMDMVSFEM